MLPLTSVLYKVECECDAEKDKTSPVLPNNDNPALEMNFWNVQLPHHVLDP
jgi:hypothetical protein